MNVLTCGRLRRRNYFYQPGLDPIASITNITGAKQHFAVPQVMLNRMFEKLREQFLR